MVLYMGRDSIDESSKSSLNFSTIPAHHDEDEFGFSRKKAARDPMSHRIIEKRRRDRMNNCLADLSRLIPTAYLKKGRGRIEKTEIIEMAIKHLKHLQAHSCKDPTNCEVAKTAEQDRKRQYRLGYQECMSETLRFLVEIEGMFAGGDGVCLRLVNHLQKHYDKITGGMCYAQSLTISEDSRSIPMDIEIHSMNGDSMCSTAISSRTGTSTPTVAATTTTTLAGTIPAYPIPLKAHDADCVDIECPKMESAMPHSPALSSHQCTSFSPAASHPPSSAPEAVTASSHGSTPVTSSASSGSTGCTSQLREMLQNPGLPMERLRSNSNSSNHSCSSLNSLRHSLAVTMTVGQTLSTPSTPLSAAAAAALRRAEEVYKFKNNIKERFNADLRHHTSSPISVHGDEQPDEKPVVDGSKHSSSYQSPSTTVPLLVPPTTNTPVTNGGNRNSYQNGLPNNSSSQQAQPLTSATELSVKIPERGSRQDSGPSSGGVGGSWENHLDSSSSSCSNPSPPSGRSNGSSSSSGYSTGGEAPYTSKVKSQHQSPSSSPYPQVTTDHMLAHSPSPQPPIRMASVPIFALHPNGSFYIPLTLDATLMAPYLSGYDDPMPILHPVNISVNFNISRALKLSERVNGITWSPRGFVYASERYTGAERCGAAVFAERVPVPYPCSPVAPN